jgi:hypothetical protein
MIKFLNFMEVFFNDIAMYTKTLSQQTLNIASIVVLHCVFVPSVIAYNTNITQTLPSLDSVLLVAFALSIMAVNSLVRRDMLAITTHLFGFVAQCVLLSFVIFK